MVTERRVAYKSDARARINEAWPLDTDTRRQIGLFITVIWVTVMSSEIIQCRTNIAIGVYVE